MELQAEIVPEPIERKIQVLEWRDFQLHGIGFVVLAVLAAGAHGRGTVFKVIP